MKQPVLLASNAYVSGAKAASGEAEAVVSGDGSSLALRETDDELWMTVSLPESIRSATGPVISTADLGQPRIVEEYFENPDGSPIVVDRDGGVWRWGSAHLVEVTGSRFRLLPLPRPLCGTEWGWAASIWQAGPFSICIGNKYDIWLNH